MVRISLDLNQLRATFGQIADGTSSWPTDPHEQDVLIDKIITAMEEAEAARAADLNAGLRQSLKLSQAMNSVAPDSSGLLIDNDNAGPTPGPAPVYSPSSGSIESSPPPSPLGYRDAVRDALWPGTPNDEPNDEPADSTPTPAAKEGLD